MTFIFWDGVTYPCELVDYPKSYKITIGKLTTYLSNRESLWRHSNPPIIIKKGDLIVVNDDGTPFNNFKYLQK